MESDTINIGQLFTIVYFEILAPKNSTSISLQAYRLMNRTRMPVTGKAIFSFTDLHIFLSVSLTLELNK